MTTTTQLRNTVKPLIITKNAAEVCKFIEKVFHGAENKAARTLDDDGLLIHSEFTIGDSIVVVLDTKDGWPFTPSFQWVIVENAHATLEIAKGLGARIITAATDFYGDTFSRLQDPWGNIWWVYEFGEQTDWDAAPEDGEEAWSSEPDPETLKNLNYIYDSLMQAMPKLGTHESDA